MAERVNKVYINQTTKKVEKMSKDKAMSYLRGAIGVGGNKKTTDALRELREAVAQREN